MSLPNEIIFNICKGLSAKDLYSFMNTCKDFRNSFSFYDSIKVNKLFVNVGNEFYHHNNVFTSEFKIPHDGTITIDNCKIRKNEIEVFYVPNITRIYKFNTSKIITYIKMYGVLLLILQSNIIVIKRWCRSVELC